MQSLIEVNSLHSDFVAEREDAGRFKQYLLALITKEMSRSLNFKDMGENEVLERFVELNTALQRAGV